MARAGRKVEREPLSAERIEHTALDLIEREGMAAFSTRKLAAELGCEAMSIYHYFPSKGHLLDALVDRVVGTEMTVPEGDVRHWRPALEAAAREWRGLARRRPQFFNYLIMHRLNTPRALKWLDGMIGFMRRIGIGDEAAARMFRVLGFYLAGALIEETAGYWRGHSTVAPVPEDVMQREYPSVVAAGPWFQEEQWEKTFELGLKVILDGLESMVERADHQARG